MGWSSDGLVEMIRPGQSSPRHRLQGSNFGDYHPQGTGCERPGRVARVPRWAHQPGARQALRSLPDLDDEQPDSLGEALAEGVSTPLDGSRHRGAPPTTLCSMTSPPRRRRRCETHTASEPTPPRSSSSSSATTPNGSAPRPRSRSSAAPAPSRRHQDKPAGTASTEAATAKPTRRSTESPSYACVSTNPPSTTSLAAPQKASPKRHHPLPQTVPRPRGLPTRHGRPPRPATRRSRRLNQLFDYRGVNALMESFWARMQVELLDRQRWPTRIELANAIFDYLEIFHTTGNDATPPSRCEPRSNTRESTTTT